MVTTAAGVLLFGGNSGNDIYFDDTWQWHGGTWIQVDRAPRPPGRGGAAVAWDQSKSTMFVFGGVGLKTSAGPGALGTALSDAWSLSGEKWSQLGSGAGAVTFANALVNNGRFVVLLGAGCPSLSDIAWAWDGSSWARAGKPGIPARWGASLAVTPDGKALLFGGSNQPAC